MHLHHRDPEVMGFLTFGPVCSTADAKDSHHRGTSYRGEDEGMDAHHPDLTRSPARAHTREGDWDVWMLLDERGRLLRGSPATLDVVGRTAGGIAGLAALSPVHPADWTVAQDAFDRALQAGGAPVPARVRVMGASGSWHDIALQFRDERDDPDLGGILVHGTDVTEARRERIAQQLESALLATLPTAVIVTDDDGIVVSWNEAAAELYGWRRSRALGRAITELNIGPSGQEAAEEIMREVMRTGRWEGDYDARRADGSVVPIHARLSRIEVPEIGFSGLVGASFDVSDRRRLEEDVAYRILHDDLTGLPNRRLAVSRLEEFVRSAAPDRLTVVVKTDMDDFAGVNQTHGAVVADEVLRVVADRLSRLDGVVVARTGGDQFLVAAEAVPGLDGLAHLVDAVRAQLAPPLRALGVLVDVTASIGTAWSDGTDDAGVLLRRAKAALQSEKRRRQAAEDSDDVIHAHDPEEVLGDLLEAALDSGSLATHFQPLVDMRDGAVVGFEALARWPEVDVGPETFVRLAERRGCIDRLTDQVVADACALLRQLALAVPERPCTVAVNVTPSQLEDAELAEIVSGHLERAGVLPARLCLEVTEGALSDATDAVASLARLKAEGIQIAVDDFGVGYSSLSRLSHFPLDHLKIDKSFVDGLDGRAENLVITASIVNLADTLGIGTVAEGVERPDQVTRLLELGCTVGQGFLWSGAVSADEALRIAAGGPLHHDAGTGRRELTAERTARGPSVDDAVALIAHELAQPVQIITGFADLIASDVDDDVRVAGVAAIGRAARRTEGVLSLVRDARALDRGTMALRRRPTPLSQLVADALDGLGAGERDRVRCGRIPDVELDVDPDRLACCLANLVTNAVTHTPTGTPAFVFAEMDEARVVVHVLDSGPGVPPEQVGRIFRRFGRGDLGTPGTGLGLYVARGVARAHGGDVTYRPRVGGGADFALELRRPPRCPAPEPGLPSAP